MIRAYLEWLWREKGYRWEQADILDIRYGLRIRGEQVTVWLSKKELGIS